jgi:hypothetical protein
VAGTLDIALNDDTTLLLIRTTADATLRTLGTTAINPGGREVMIEHDRLSGTGILTIAHNTVGTFTSFFCPNALSIAVGQTTCLEARLRNGFWRPQGTAGQIVTASITDANVTLPKLATQAANTIVANDTAGVASPTAVAIGTNTVLGRVGGNIVAAQLVASQIGANQIGNPLLAQMLANTVKVNATAATADPQDVAIGANTVLGRVAGNIVAAQVVTSQIGANQVTNPVLAQMAALTVKANPTGALANAADLAASSDDTVLRRVAGALSFGTLTAGMFPAAVIPLASLAAQAANTIVANATAGSASPTAVAIGTNSVLGRVAGNIVAAQLVTAQIAASQVTNALLAQMAANTVKVNATAALADAQDVAIGTNSVLGRVAGNIVAAQLVTAQIAVNQVTNPLLAQMLANTVKVNATAVTADPQDVAIGTNSVLGRVAGNIVAAQIVTSQIGASQITNALLANMAPGTMKGQTVDGATGAPVDLTGLEQAENWRRETVQTVSGVAGTLDIALNDDTTLLLIRTTADATLRTLGTTAINPGGREVMIEHDRLSGTGTLTIAHNTAGTFTPFFCPNALSIAMGQTTCLEARLRSGFWRPQGTAGQIVTASITDANVTLPKLAVQAANTIVANATAGSASPTAVAIGTNSVLGRVAGNIVAAQLVNSQMVGGATATLKGVAINGIAGTLTDITLTQLGDMFRLVSGVTDVLAPATIDDYAVAETTKLLRININADGDLNITGFALGTNNGGGWFRLFNQSTSVVRRIVLKNATGSSLGNQIITPDGLDFVLDRFGDAVDLQAIGGRWQVVQLSKAMQANSVRVNASSATANAQNLAIGTNSVLGRVAGNIVAAQLVTGQLADANVTYAKIQNVQALSILARTVNSAGVVQELHSPGSFAVPYDDGAGNLVFATLVTGNYGNASVTLPKLATQAANTIVANDTAGVASPNAVAIGTNSVLGRVAGNIVAAQLVNAQMANMADGTVKGRARGAGAGVPTDLTQTQAAAVAAPSIAQSIGYTAAAPIALTTLAAGHPAGLYLVSADAIVRTAGSTGTLARTASYNAPTLGAATTGAFPGGSITGTGRIPNSAALGASSILIPYTVRSDGTADIVTTFTPTGVSGSPVIDLYTSAALIGL